MTDVRDSPADNAPTDEERTSAVRCPYPFTRDSAVDIPAVYEELRAECPVKPVTFPSNDEGFVLSRYADVKVALSDSRFSRRAMLDAGAPKLSSVIFPPNTLFTTDAPEHTRLRKLVTAAFTNRRITELRPRIQEITDSLLDAMAAAGSSADLNTALSFPMPIQVICELLGVPAEDQDRFRTWSDAFVSLTHMSEEEVHKNRFALAAYLKELVDSRRADPRDDLLSALTTKSDEDGALSEIEVVMMAITILVAGHETTVSMTSSLVLNVLRDDALREQILTAPEKTLGLVDELLRVNPIGDGGPYRVTLEDVEIGGQLIPKGSGVIASVASANQDEEQFPRAKSVDLERGSQGHLAFGHGIHFCLGANLARVELEIALNSLFHRFPGIRLADSVDNLTMRGGMLVHGLERLPVAW
ncbi:cytochrome P450 [Nocardia sp. NPDC058705]|uniref:cytochrome P450 n=1 Tax=Nocardia sp. NPDC058705 TaxID=3346609 RepID=UPI0036AE2F6B